LISQKAIYNEEYTLRRSRNDIIGRFFWGEMKKKKIWGGQEKKKFPPGALMGVCPWDKLLVRQLAELDKKSGEKSLVIAWAVTRLTITPNFLYFLQMYLSASSFYLGYTRIFSFVVMCHISGAHESHRNLFIR